MNTHPSHLIPPFNHSTLANLGLEKEKKRQTCVQLYIEKKDIKCLLASLPIRLFLSQTKYMNTCTTTRSMLHTRLRGRLGLAVTPTLECSAVINPAH